MCLLNGVKMMKRFQIFQGLIIFVLFINVAWCADKISGSACYTYGDNESLVQAEQMAKTLAIRNAIESYSTFVESTTQVKDLQLSTDLINTVSVGQVKDIKVLKRLESGRKLCYTVEGFVEASELRNAITKYLEGGNDHTQLQNNGYIEIIGESAQLILHCEKPSPDNKSRLSNMFRLSGDEIINDTTLAKIGYKEYECMRQLLVAIRFQKHCVASTLPPPPTPSGEDIMRNPKKYLDSLISQEAWDSIIPRYRCDYRFKVFVTFYSKEGLEIETQSEYPRAEENKLTKEWEKEKVPGEISSLAFFLPENAKTWKVWVPR